MNLPTFCADDDREFLRTASSEEIVRWYVQRIKNLGIRPCLKILEEILDSGLIVATAICSMEQACFQFLDGMWLSKSDWLLDENALFYRFTTAPHRFQKEDLARRLRDLERELDSIDLPHHKTRQCAKEIYSRHMTIDRKF